jgi:lysophospholipase L1-like esterase
MQQGLTRWIATVCVALATLAGCASAPERPGRADLHWVASWGTAQMIPEPHNSLAPEQWRDASLRQIVRLSLGGSRMRVRISNAFGTEPLAIDAASVAKAVAAGRVEVNAATLQRLTFDGRHRVMIPAGAEYYSDPVTLPHTAATDLAVSLHFKEAPARQTGHPGSRTTSFVAPGDRVLAAAWPDAARVVRWYQLADVEVEAPRDVAAVVAIGDSITDGYGATTDGNNRWTDLLASRMAREGAPAMGVVNAGIGGGRMLRDGLGPNLASRFERDVLARAGVTHAIVLIGVNDLGSQHRNNADTPEARAQMLQDLQTAYRQIVERAHAHKVCVLGATILPYVGSDYYRPQEHNEADRRALNAWIRSSGVFDAVADFDAATRDPARPERLRAELDTGDGLHPSLAGFRAMAEAVPLAALRSCSWAR